jgi:hypothetical protein
MKLKRIMATTKNRISGNGSFPSPQIKDIGREVIVKRNCITWDGCLGYFADDNKKVIYAFYLDELK